MKNLFVSLLKFQLVLLLALLIHQLKAATPSWRMDSGTLLSRQSHEPGGIGLIVISRKMVLQKIWNG